MSKAIHELSVAKPTLSAKKLKLPRSLLSRMSYYRAYAALGPEGIGSTIEEICKRSKLTEVEVTRILSLMKQNGIVRIEGGRFIADQANIELFGLSTNDGLCELVEDFSKFLSRKSRTIVESSQDIIVYTSFCIDAKNVLKFKSKLRAAVYQVIDEFQNDSAEQVRQIFLVSTDCV